MKITNDNVRALFTNTLETLEVIVANKQKIQDLPVGPAYPSTVILTQGDVTKKLEIYCALCTNIAINFESLSFEISDQEAHVFDNQRTQIHKNWPNYSGNEIYPVPMPEHFEHDWDDYSDLTTDLDNQTEKTKAYAAFQTTIDVRASMFVGDYGELRFQLADHLIKKIKGLLNA